MEWIWYIIASVGAGIGTGLAGLSAVGLVTGAVLTILVASMLIELLGCNLLNMGLRCR